MPEGFCQIVFHTKFEVTNEKLEMAIFIFDHSRSRVPSRACDNQGPQFMEIGRRYWFGERQLARENWGDSDLVGLNVDVGGDNRASGIIDTLALVNRSEVQSVRAKQS